MLDSETLEKLQNVSIEERINIIEALLHSLKNDIKKGVSPEINTDRPQRPPFGFMKGSAEIVGDVVDPALSEDAWEVLQ
jgi:hypothetical protein